MGVGMGAVEKAVERSKLRSGGSGEFLPGIFWADDKGKENVNYRKVLRFLTDDVITCKIYEFVKGGPENKGRDFYAPQSIVEEIDNPDGTVTTRPLWEELANEKDYFLENNIWLPDFKQKLVAPGKYAKEKTTGLAVLREEIKESINGKRLSTVHDLVVEREWKDGDDKVQKESGLFFGIVKQGHKNFWSTLVGYYNRYGTIIDRDYEIIRNGNGTDTQYVILPMDPDPAFIPADDEKHEDGTPVTTADKIAERYYGEGEGKLSITLKDYIVPKARYAAAEEWVKGKGSPPQTEPTDHGQSVVEPDGNSDAGERIRQPASSAGKSLKEQLESYAKTS